MIFQRNNPFFIKYQVYLITHQPLNDIANKENNFSLNHYFFFKDSML